MLHRGFGSVFVLNCIAYGSPKVPKPLNREGNFYSTMAVQSVMLSILDTKFSATMPGKPSRLTL